MFEQELKKLEQISQAVGNDPDITQGGGGNTSVKLDNRLMAVKASGFRLKDITSENGFVVVDYSRIKEYHKSVNTSEEKDYDTDSANFIKECIVEINGIKPLKPSVEAGFHSLLDKYVIHTHSVYANIICCAENGKDLVDLIFKGKNFSYIWIPYINPGFSLTMSILEGISDEKFNGGISPISACDVSILLYCTIMFTLLSTITA
jgi:rhamnose utilization protein RhaD (predicted bifunctional aldolase and dehydrogenase)